MSPSTVKEDWEKLITSFSKKHANLSENQIKSIKSVFFAGILAQYDFHRKLGAAIMEGEIPITDMSKTVEEREKDIYAMALEIGFDLETGKPLEQKKSPPSKQKPNLN